MSTITDVKQIPGFNQQQYDSLIAQARSQKVDISLVDASLLDAVNNGKDFSAAMQTVKTDLPTLVKPDASLSSLLSNWPGMPAPGALVMALITEISADQRQQNRELSWAQTEAIVDSMQEQAKEMRNMAIAQLVLGMAAAATTVAGGIAQSSMAASGLKMDAADKALQSSKAQGVGTAVGGGASFLSAGSQFAGSMYQASFKEMEADQERMRALRDSLKDLNEGLKELIQKTLSSTESMQQSKNQATTRILA